MGTTKTFFFPNQGFFTQFSKKRRWGLPHSPPPSYVPVSVAEYGSEFLNIYKYPWNCLKKPFWLSQGAEYAWSSYMFEKLLNMPQVLNMPGFWIWHCCICKDYTEFWISLNMAQYASTMPEYVSICLDVPQYDWPWLNIDECYWTCLKMP